MLSQKEAVYNTTIQVLKEAGIKFEQGMVAGSVVDKDSRATIVSILVDGFSKGEIELKSAQDDLKSYTNSLVSNWFRKDTRLNGGVKYEAKNPGARAGQQDPTVKNLRLLSQRFPEGSKEHSAIMAKVEARVNELKLEKAAKALKEINADFIPEEFKHLLD